MSNKDTYLLYHRIVLYYRQCFLRATKILIKNIQAKKKLFFQLKKSAKELCNGNISNICYQRLQGKKTAKNNLRGEEQVDNDTDRPYKRGANKRTSDSHKRLRKC